MHSLRHYTEPVIVLMSLIQIGASVELYYDGPQPPAGLFDAFLAIPSSWQSLHRTWQDRQDNLPGNHQTYRFGRPNGVDDLSATCR
jgi:hypothetical protein